MNEIFQCGDSGALVAYLYDECSPGEHAVIAAHISGCVTCASEIDALSATRRTLASWKPPDLALGFQITRSDVAAKEPARVLEPKIAWWRAPLPAWAQAAAALVIFAAGLSVGTLRTGSAPQTATTQPSATAPADARATAPSASRDDLARLEQRLRTEFARLSSTPNATPAAARGSDDALIARVKTLIEESAADERRGFTERMLSMADIIERQRRVDMASIGQSVGELRGVTREQLLKQDEAYNAALRRLVSDSAR